MRITKFTKTLICIIAMAIALVLCACDQELKIDKEYTLEYFATGNGRVTCDTPSGSKVSNHDEVYIYAYPAEGERLINWFVNGQIYGLGDIFASKLKKDSVIEAFFTIDGEVPERSSDQPQPINQDYQIKETSIYAKLPVDWLSPSISYVDKKTNRSATYNMMEVAIGVWEFDPLQNGTTKGNVSNIKFSTQVNNAKSSRIFTFDPEFNFFSYSGYDKDGLLCGGFGKEAVKDVFKLSVIEFNDLHGYIVQSDGGTSGISNASYMINRVRAENDKDNVVLVANGDMFQGTALSNLSHGLTVLKCMNQMNFDFMGIGNHEFDWGLELIMNYFDGDKTNGEADFPLVNSNISDKNTNKLLTQENMVETYMFEKNGIKIGVISMIDDLKSSILASRVQNYNFLGLQKAKEQAISLKNQGADIIIANIHGGDSDGVEKFDYNQQLSKLEYNGEWLIDCVINGHTHTRQTGYIERTGRDLPIVQGGSYCYYIGQIDLYVDMDSKKLLTSTVDTYSTYDADTNYDKQVEDIIDTEYLTVKDQMEEIYCTSTAKVSSKYDYCDWVGNVMKAAAGCICGISNTGGLRSTGNINSGTKIGLENMYLVNPFDNQIVIVEITGRQLYKFLNNNDYVFYTLDSNYTLNSLATDDTKHKVAVIDYVYYWNEFPKGQNDIFTDLVLRDIMIADLRLRDTFNVKTDKEALIGSLVH